MSKALNPRTLCNLYTLEQIEAKITLYSDALERAASVKSYQKDYTQGNQKVDSADPDKIETLLAAWLKAKECKLGMGRPRIISANFSNPGACGSGY